ncbi:MAG: DUF1846 domain-containing protein [Firmicutes bacterium]|nr:DUF1846 domain-containing protein [Bacillota bacterium]
MQIGFDPQLYMELQTKYIKERIEKFNNKLYLEFGGKLFDDYHAARVLPGFASDAKIKLLLELKDITEIIFAISAADIEKNKIRADIGISYDMDVLRLIDNLSDLGLRINAVVITQYTDQVAALVFRNRLTARGIKTYLHGLIKGYPYDVDAIVSEEGYGANPYIETTRPLVVVTAPGPGSGKLATCLSQVYHEQKRGVEAGYAKFETFPIWNIPLKHPVNLAYEAATVDLRDFNAIDPYHLEAYGETTVNYNRDIEMFPVVKAVLQRVYGKDIYKSPTDMGVNMAGRAIVDDAVVRQAAQQEIIRRYFKTRCEARQGLSDKESVERIEMIMQQLGLREEDRAVVAPAREKAKQRGVTAIAFQLPNGRITTGRASELMSAAASGLINAIKALAGIEDSILLLSLVVLEPIVNMKKQVLNSKDSALTLSDVLIALSLCAATSPIVEMAIQKLPLLRGCEAHCSAMLPAAEEDMLRRLGVNFTCDPAYTDNALYQEN